MLAVKTYTLGQIRNRPQPSQVHSSSSSTARTERTRLTSGARNEPSSTQPPKAATSTPTRPGGRLWRWPRTTTANRTPTPMKFDSPNRSAQVRRNRWSQRKRNPSASRERSDERSGSRLLERRPHGQHRDGREGVGDGVDQERERPGEPEQRPAERRAGQPDRGQPARLGARGPWQLARRHHGAERPGLRGREQGGADAIDEGDQRDRPEAEPVGQDGGGEAADREHADAVGGDHQPPAVPAVGHHAGGQREQRQGQGVGDHRRLRAHLRQQLPGLEEQEVAVPPEGDRGHASIGSTVTPCPASQASARASSSSGPDSSSRNQATPDSTSTLARRMLTTAVVVRTRSWRIGRWTSSGGRVQWTRRLTGPPSGRGRRSWSRSGSP